MPIFFLAFVNYVTIVVLNCEGQKQKSHGRSITVKAKIFTAKVRRFTVKVRRFTAKAKKVYGNNKEATTNAKTNKKKNSRQT